MLKEKMCLRCIVYHQLATESMFLLPSLHFYRHSEKNNPNNSSVKMFIIDTLNWFSAKKCNFAFQSLSFIFNRLVWTMLPPPIHSATVTSAHTSTSCHCLKKYYLVFGKTNKRFQWGADRRVKKRKMMIWRNRTVTMEPSRFLFFVTISQRQKPLIVCIAC